jgi:hypothetical protein
MPDVARILLGPPNRKLSSGKELRWGNNGSLSIDIPKGTWFDHERGEGGGVLDFIRIREGLEGEDAFDWMRSKGIVGKPNLSRIVATFPYTDEAGEVLFEVVKYDPKSFKQRRPDGRGGWIWNVDGVCPIPYRLPELIEAVANERVVAVPEGEKDCNKLWDIGIAATTNAGGAGKWKAELNGHFRGADVVLIPHNDEAGRKHAPMVAAQLKSVAKRVRILELWRHWPAMPVKGDVNDWLEKGGGTREKLDALIAAAPEYVAESESLAAKLDDFCAYLPQHAYVYLPTRELWPASSVDAKLGKVGGKTWASKWLDQNRPLMQMTWAPGLPALISDRVVDQGGWIEKQGVTIFNLYRPPTIVHGDASKAGPWVDHVRKIYPDDAEHIIHYFAHRVQRPHEKINHGLVLGGPPGTGKDTLLEPIKHSVGPWNVCEVSPQQVLGRFNGFVKSILLRVSEARDLGELNRFALYEHMKVYLAAPPDVVRCDEKNLREHAVFNCMGVVITSNRKDSFYLPEDDRRYYVAWTDRAQTDFEDGYWSRLWQWYEADGYGHVAAYLATLDISSFNPKAPPPKTPAFWQIVEANRAPENSELADALDELGNPDAVTIPMILAKSEYELGQWLRDRRNSRHIHYRMGDCGYVLVRNSTRSDGYWQIGGKRQAIYAKAQLSVREQHVAAAALIKPEQLRGL